MTARVAVLVSGSGSNLQAIIDAQRHGDLHAEVTVVISNRPGVLALDRAAKAGVESLVIDHKLFSNRAAFDRALHDALSVRHVELLALAGFMRLLTPSFVSQWRGRLINIHPSLLPAFPGAHAIRDALAAGASKTGVTVHFVDEGTDTGPILAQAEVAVAPDDTEETLAARIHAVEHRLYPKVLDALACGRVTLEGRRVVGTIDAGSLPP